MNHLRKMTAGTIGSLILGVSLSACGLTKADKSSHSSSHSQTASGESGFASFSLADLTSLGDIKGVNLTITGADVKGSPFKRVVSEDYATGKSFKASDLPTGVYKVTLEVTDASGKVLATGEASSVTINAGAETKLSLTLTKAGDSGSLVVQVVPGAVPPGGKTDPGVPAPAPNQTPFQGYDENGNFKTCPTPIHTDRTDICFNVAIDYAPSSISWADKCKKLGFAFTSCSTYVCDHGLLPIKGEALWLCSGKVILGGNSNKIHSS